MLREEELNMSPETTLQMLTRTKQHGEKDFSFIQNRVPSPLNNNFLLSEEQSRHIRQPSEGFMTAAHNLMNQDEFRVDYYQDQDQIDEEESSSGGDELETSKMSLFTDDQKKVRQRNIRDEESYVDNQNEGEIMPLITESNNDDFNYSESNYQFVASSSLGAIIQGMNGGSFIGFQAAVNSNHHQNNNSRSSGNRMITSGRESATPFNYDENSLMNLSYTPTSNILLKASLGKNNMVQILEDKKEEEEQDESMLPNSYMKPQDEWFMSKKNNPLEMPLQIQDNEKLFSRAKPTEEELAIHDYFYQNQQSLQQQSSQDENEDEMQMIKKRLDFSRLSSLQNLSQNQIYLGQQIPNSFLFQTQQSQMSNQSAINDTQHYSTIQGVDRDNAIPFEELLSEHMKSRNNELYRTQNNKKDEGVQVDNDRLSCDTAGVGKEPGVSPPSRNKSSLNSTRPPLLKPLQQQQQPQQISVFPSRLTVNNSNQPIQLNCINIFQGPGIPPITEQQIPLLNYSVPPASRTNSTNSYSNSIVENQIKKINCHPNSDTPGEPSSLMIDDTFINQPNSRKMVQIQNQIISNQQQIFNNQNFIIPGASYQDIHFDDETDDSKDQMKATSSKATKQMKPKKKVKEQIQKQQPQCRLATSRSRKAVDVKQMHNLSQKQMQLGFMSKTMIISKDKIQPAKAFNEQQSKQQQIIENIIQQNQIQKYKQTKVKKINKIASSQHPLTFNPQQAYLNSGRSLPNSNISSAQTSFLNSNNTKKAPQKTTTKKSSISSKDTSQVEDKQMKKLKKKNQSIVRQQLQTLANNTQQINLQHDNVSNKQATKCNTHRSVSRPKSGFKKEQDYDQLMINPVIQLGKKKHSQQVFITSENVNNKENIRPASSNKGINKKSFNMVGAQLNRPEQMLQSYENIKILNAQDLLKEIYIQQQRLSTKNFQHLFTTTMEATSHNDIQKRMKTEGDHVRSLQTFDGDFDPYHALTTLDTQRFVQPINADVYENLYKAAINQQQSSSNTSSMQKMQSPYNSKSMKNKFSTNKTKKGEVHIAQVKGQQSQNCQPTEQTKECKRCDELIHMLKNTRFLAR